MNTEKELVVPAEVDNGTAVIMDQVRGIIATGLASRMNTHTIVTHLEALLFHFLTEVPQDEAEAVVSHYRNTSTIRSKTANGTFY